MFLRKNMIVIGILLLVALSSLYAGNDTFPLPHTGVVHTATWEDGYQQVYLYSGTYHFYLEAWITCNPFVPGNLWIYRGIVQGEYDYSGYGEAFQAVTNVHFDDVSGSFELSESGWYNVRCGAYAHYGVIMNQNAGSLICDYVSAWIPDQ
ncbi:MAG: hypothetical protein KAW88_05645 [Candidatus Cloacimonetes bacterium]|nr:hypothetical protein [Candidatus Cloacimonadota bacterium]